MQRRRTWRSSIFEKMFFMSEKCRLQNLHAIFWPFLMDFYLCKIFRLINGLWKKIQERHVLHLHMLYRMVKKRIRKNIVEDKITRMVNGPFLPSVKLITSSNLRISGWNFYRRLPALVLRYPENFSRFGPSLAKNWIWGGGLNYSNIVRIPQILRSYFKKLFVTLIVYFFNLL